MFSCCCPKELPEDENQKQKQIQEELLHKSSRPSTEIAPKSDELDRFKQPSPSIQKIMPVNTNLQKMKEIQIDFTANFQGIDEFPVLENKGSLKSLSLNKFGSFQESQKIKNKSDLWEQESGTKILYYFNHKGEEMVFGYKVTKVKTQDCNSFNHALNSHKILSKSKYKMLEPSINLIITSKSLSDVKTLVKTLQIETHIRVIFGVFKKQDQSKIPKNYFQSQQIYDTIVLGNNCMRIQFFDKIVISTLQQKQFSSIFQFCQKSTEFYELQDLVKIVFLFPPQLTLSQITLILSKLFRKFVISEKLQKILKYIAFHIELIEGDNIQSFILVRSNMLHSQSDQIYSRQFETRLQLSIGLLLIEIDYNNFKSYKKLIDNFFNDMSITKYLKFIQYLHKQKKQFITKLQELKIFQHEQLMQIQKSNRIQQKLINNSQKCIIIKHRSKRKMGQLFAQYKNIQTPVQQSQNKKKQWDDDLKANDIRVTIMDKNEDEHQTNHCNIFQVIDDSYVDKADLDIIGDLDPIDFKDNE